MVILYIVFCFLTFVVGRLNFKNFFNPICLYTVVWLISVCIHQSGLIVYYELNGFTWIVIFFSHLLFVMGALSARIFEKTVIEKEPFVLEDVQKKLIYRFVILCLCVSGFSIVLNVRMMILRYGMNLFENMMVIYQDRLTDSLRTEVIPYISSFLFIAMPLLGIYIKKFGFTLLLIVGLILSCLNSLTSGGRAGIIFALLLFLSGYMISDGLIINRLKMFFDQKRKLGYLGISVIALIIMIVAISEQRSAGIELDYATNRYTSIFGYNVPLYKGLVYLASPIGVLNEYLKNCEFDFGKNTFVAFYGFLSKLNLCDKVNPYQDYFATPSLCNVGTWVRELIEDFTIGGAIVFIAIFGMLSSIVYSRALCSGTIVNKFIWTIFALVIILSFFDWKFRTSNLWIALFFGILISRYIDVKSADGIKND